MTGVNWNVRIRPIRVLGIEGGGYSSTSRRAILYAAGLPAEGAGGDPVVAPNRAPIINMSLGGPGDSTLGAAVAAAIAAGSVIIASAGNVATHRRELSRVVSRRHLRRGARRRRRARELLDVATSSCRSPRPAATSASTIPRSSCRRHERHSVDGVEFHERSHFHEQVGPDYAFYTGTSMAAPHVSGVAALVLAANPGMTGAQLRARLTSTAVDIGPPGVDARYGYGRVNAYNAVTGTQGPPMQIYVSAINASTGAVAKTVKADADNSYKLDGTVDGLVLRRRRTG